jgi:hypothetical protein
MPHPRHSRKPLCISKLQRKAELNRAHSPVVALGHDSFPARALLMSYSQ